jgi:hypothetical protein
MRQVRRHFSWSSAFGTKDWSWERADVGQVGIWRPRLRFRGSEGNSSGARDIRVPRTRID